MKVHPDFFTKWPEIQDVNEASFQTLMAFLDELEKVEDQAGQFAANMRHTVVFFIKDPKSSAKIDAKAAEIPGLRKTEIVLEAFGKQQITKSMHQSLAKLFDACGVEHSMDAMTSQEAIPKKREWKEEFSVLHFIRKIHETARQKAQIRLTVERELDMERTVFYIQHQIRISVEQTPELDENWKTRVDLEKSLLQRLGTVLQTLHFEKHVNLEKYANTTVYFGGRSGIDLLGRIGLRMSDSDAQWVEQLAAIDREEIERIKDGSADRFDLEKQLSDCIGIDYIYTDYALGGTSRYRDFVSQLHAVAESSGYKLVNADQIKLRVLDSSDPKTFRIDVPTCTVVVPIAMGPSRVLEVLQERHQDLLKEYMKLNMAQEELNAIVLSAKRKFRLRALTWDPLLTRPQILHCLTSIIRYAVQLSRSLECQRIKISDKYLLDDRDGTIHIKWDFML